MFDLSTPEGLQQAQQAFAKPTAATTEKLESAKETDGPLTETEVIQVVQKWELQDEDYELSERMSSEEMVERLQDAANARGSKVPVSKFKEIVAKYAPDAPHREAPKSITKDALPYPTELTPLIQSGVAFQDEQGYWLVRRCDKCGNFKTKCCGSITPVGAVDFGTKTLTHSGRQAVGLDPIKPPKPPETVEQIKQNTLARITKEPWWIVELRGLDELQGNGNVKMYINNFLPEGICIISGLPKEGKSWLGMSIAKSLTSGKPLFGKPGFEVPESVPVLYLAAESGDGALKLRCQRMGITTDKTRFVCRTLSQGVMLTLEDPVIESVIKALKPVVILETLIRFNEGSDEDSATENRKLAESMFRLRSWGAPVVIGIHHSRKDLDKRKPTKEAAIRGSGDGLAMADVIWLVMQDEQLYQGGKGPNEVEIVGWGRDFNPVPLRLALTRKKTTDDDQEFAPGIVSCIDTQGDFEWVKKGLVFKPSSDQIDQDVERLVTENPSRTLEDIIEKTGHSKWQVREALKRLGYKRGSGNKDATRWAKADSKVT